VTQLHESVNLKKFCARLVAPTYGPMNRVSLMVPDVLGEILELYLASTVQLPP
jgi:hypothetical protein